MKKGKQKLGWGEAWRAQLLPEGKVWVTVKRDTTRAMGSQWMTLTPSILHSFSGCEWGEETIFEQELFYLDQWFLTEMGRYFYGICPPLP